MFKTLQCQPVEDQDGYALKFLQFSEMEQIRQARNAQMDVLRQSSKISKEEQITYFNEVIAPNLKKSNPEMILFSLFKDDHWIGYGGLTHLNWEHKRGEVSFLVEKARSKNSLLYRQDFLHFLQLLSSIAFTQLHLHRIYTETFDFRDQHIKILETFGFIYEGTLREHLLIKGVLHDSIMHGLLSREYLP